MERAHVSREEAHTAKVAVAGVGWEVRATQGGGAVRRQRMSEEAAEAGGGAQAQVGDRVMK
eukprot:300315-Chlamydomonas_euryale.AAC.2